MSISLDEQIRTVEKRVVATNTEMKAAQSRWDDCRAGNLKIALARDVGFLKTLYAQRAANTPVDGVKRPSGQVFFGSPF